MIINYSRLSSVVLFLSLLLVSWVILFEFLPPHKNAVVPTNNWKHDLDSVTAEDRKMAVAMKVLQIRRTNDSLRLVSIQAKLDSFDFVTNSIIAIYEKERASIIALPLNDRIRFFSGWLQLPKTDSL